MTFINNPITDANPGPLLANELEVTLLALGFTLFDTVVSGARTHRIYKSAAAGNSHALDWYLDVNYPTTGISGGFYITPFENYDAATDLGIRGPYTGSSTALDGSTYSRYGATGQGLESSQWTNSTGYVAMGITLTTSTFIYWASITRDRVILMMSSDASRIHYCGFFNPSAAHEAHAGASVYPLIRCVLSGASGGASQTSNPTAALTRLPKAAAMASGWGASVYVTAPVEQLAGQIGAAASDLTNEKTAVEYVVVGGANSVAAAVAATAGEIGRLVDVRAAKAVSSALRGDTLTIDGVAYMAATITNSVCALMAQV